MPLPRALRRFLLLVASVFILLASLLRWVAGDEAKGDWGERCVQTSDCKDGLECGVKYAAPYCTTVCETDAQCPSGWSCAAVCRK
jgi:hypothetical protein